MLLLKVSKLLKVIALLGACKVDSCLAVCYTPTKNTPLLLTRSFTTSLLLVSVTICDTSLALGQLIYIEISKEI